MGKEQLEVTLMLTVEEEDVNKYIDAYNDGRMVEFLKFGLRFNFDHLKITEALIANAMSIRTQPTANMQHSNNNVSTPSTFIEPIGIIKPKINNSEEGSDETREASKPKPRGKGILGRKRIQRK